MNAGRWYCIAQTGTFNTSCGISVAFDSSSLLLAASVKYGVSSLNVSSTNLEKDYNISVRLRETNSQWFVDLKSNVEIEPTVEIADSSVWTAGISTAGAGNIIAKIDNITEAYNDIQDTQRALIESLVTSLDLANATIADLQLRLRAVEDWGFQFTLTPQGTRTLVTPHNFVSHGSMAFAGQTYDEEFEHRIEIITEEEYEKLVADGNINETKVYYVY